MKAVQYSAAGRENGRVTDIPYPVCGDNQVIIKVMSAGIRLGFVIAPKPVLDKMAVGKQAVDTHSNLFFQILIAEYMEKYDYDGHIQMIRDLYRHKSGLMLDEIRKGFPKSVKYTVPQGGLFLWCTLPDGADMLKFPRKFLSRAQFM